MRLKYLFIIFSIFHWTLLGANSAPTITSSPTTSVDEDTSYSYTFSGSDEDDDTFTWSITDGTTLPSWLTPTVEWEYLGSEGFTGGEALYLAMDIDSDNTPYVVYRDDENSDYASVMKYVEDDNSWVYVGDAGFSAGTIMYADIIIASDDTPYVVYKDFGNSSKATVMKYNGSAWESVGDAGFSDGVVYYTNIALDSSDTPYVVFKDYEHDKKATVMKYDDSNNSWSIVGSAGFSTYEAEDVDIAFDSYDTPYVVCEENSNISVMKYYGDEWVLVGEEGFSTGAVDEPRILIDSSDTLYVAYADADSRPYETIVKKFDGESWVTLGSTYDTEYRTYEPDLAVDNNDNLYAIFLDRDQSGNEQPTVVKYMDNNDSWSLMDQSGIPSIYTYYNAIKIGSDYRPYIMFQNSSGNHAIVMRGKITGLEGNPGNDDVGTHSVSLTLSDGIDSDVQSFDITVNNVNDAPVITSSAITNVDEDSEYEYILEATDDDADDTLTWSVTEGSTLPSWLSLTSETSWEYVGERGFSSGKAIYPAMDLDSNDNPYVLFADYDNAQEATVMKYTEDNNSWEIVGTAGFSDIKNYENSIVLDSEDTPYIAFENLNTNYPYVMRFNGSDWENVGDGAFYDGRVNYLKLAIDSTNTPYVVYRDSGNSGYPTVRKYNESNESWDYVGGRVSTEYASYLDMAFDSNDTPYVVYRAYNEDKQTVVKKYNGSEWENVGEPYFSDGEVNEIKIALDSNDTPYIMFKDVENSQKITVMKYDGVKWVVVGEKAFSEGTVHDPYIVITSDDTPYVSFSDGKQEDQVTVMKYDGEEWVYVGDRAFSESSYHVSYLELVLDSKDTPYVVYKDYVYSSATYKTTVMKLNQSRLEGTPKDEDIGVHDINLTLSDGTVTQTQNFQITVVSTNIDPTAANSSVTVNEDESYSFGSSDFSFSDEDVGDTLNALYITSLADKGELQYNGVDVTIGDRITEFANLTYTALENEYGSNYTSFGFKVNDGETNSSASYTMTINVDALNDAPTIPTTVVLSADEDSVYNYILEGSDIDGDNISWSVSDGTTLPSWLSLTPQNYWEDVGDAGNSGVATSYITMAIDANNTPYIAYAKSADSYTLEVMKYTEDNASWNLVGTSGFSGASAYHVDLAMSSTNAPYVVYSESKNSAKATLMRYADNSWEVVGDANFTKENVSDTSLVLDSTNTPYVAYSDSTGYISVMKYTGSEWVVVGSEKFSPVFASNLKIAIDSSDTPYVIFSDSSNSFKATVMKFDGSDWVGVGSAGFSASTLASVSMSFNSSDTPYVVYSAAGSNNEATVMKYDGSDWVDVGESSFSEGEAYSVDIALDSDDTPYVSYKDQANSNKATVMKYDGVNWIVVGSSGFSTNAIDSTKIVLGSDDIPYVVFRDVDDGYTATVMKLVKSNLSGTPTNDDVGVHDINLTLSDGNLTTEYNFQITVNNSDDAPVLQSIVDQETLEDDNLSLELNASDIDGDAISYSAESNDTNIATVSIVDNVVTITPLENANGVISIEVNATANGVSDTKTFEVNITAVDDAPYFTFTIGSQTMDEDAAAYRLSLSATDVEGDAFSYGVISNNTALVNVELNGSEMLITPQANQYGTTTIDLNVSQDSNGSLYERYSFSITINSINDAPTILTTLDDLLLAEDNGTTSYTLNLSDIEGDDLTITIESNDTSLIDVTPNWSGKLNQATWSKGVEYNLTTLSNAHGTAQIKVIVDDGDKNSTQTFEVNITAIDDAPTLQSIADIQTLEDNALSIELNASDAEGDAISYSAESNDTNIATVLIVDNVVMITPVENAYGTISIKVNATANGVSDSQTLTLTITAVDDAPYFTSTIASHAVDEDTDAYYLPLSATDVEGDAFSYAVVSNNPALVTAQLSGNKTLITPQPNQYGTTTIDLKVSQDSNSSLYERYSFSLTINPVNNSVNNAPTILTTLNDLSLTEDNGTTSYMLSVFDMEGDDLNITIESNDTTILNVTPNWSGLLDQATWSKGVEYNLTTQNNANGTAQIKIIVDDGEKNTTQTFDVNVSTLSDTNTTDSNSTESNTSNPDSIDSNTTDSNTTEDNESDVVDIIDNNTSQNDTTDLNSSDNSNENSVSENIDSNSSLVESNTTSHNEEEDNQNNTSNTNTTNNNSGASDTTESSNTNDNNGEEVTTTTIQKLQGSGDEVITLLSYPSEIGIQMHQEGDITLVTFDDPTLSIQVDQQGSMDMNITNALQDSTHHVSITNAGANLSINDAQDTILSPPTLSNIDQQSCDYAIAFDYRSGEITTQQIINRGLEDEVVTTIIMQINNTDMKLSGDGRLIHSAKVLNANEEHLNFVTTLDCLGNVALATTNEANTTYLSMSVAGVIITIGSEGNITLFNDENNASLAQNRESTLQTLLEPVLDSNSTNTLLSENLLDATSLYGMIENEYITWVKALNEGTTTTMEANQSVMSFRQKPQEEGVNYYQAYALSDKEGKTITQFTLYDSNDNQLETLPINQTPYPKGNRVTIYEEGEDVVIETITPLDESIEF